VGREHRVLKSTSLIANKYEDAPSKLEREEVILSDEMKMEFSSARILKLADAHNAIPTRDGKLYAELFRHGTLTVEIYAPKGSDLQQPHTRDELYIVAAGSGWFFVEGTRVQFGPGDALFAAAGEVHRFESFTEDLLVWVVFYGPEGGERA
jgi:mannose-6-phosphate isomerase-like protein (cupin superfamily)